jgi:hypothetical protein
MGWGTKSVWWGGETGVYSESGHTIWSFWHSGTIFSFICLVVMKPKLHCSLLAPIRNKCRWFYNNLVQNYTKLSTYFRSEEVLYFLARSIILLNARSVFLVHNCVHLDFCLLDFYILTKYIFTFGKKY